MSAVDTETKNNSKNELYLQYDWFKSKFLPAIQCSCDDFFSDLFSFKLTSLSKNINILFQGDDYFVTKIRIDKHHDVFFRCSESVIEIILKEVLGQTKKKFELAKITELEAKIISSFNDYIYNNISQNLLPPPSEKQKRKNTNTIHLTFFLRSNKTKDGGKFILSLPETLLMPEAVKVQNEKFNIDSFLKSQVEVLIKIGTTKFPLKDLKNLEKEDIVLFENSNIQKMKLIYKDYKKIFRITPNPGLIISIDDNNGGKNMDEHSLSQNLWDNIQVEMGAEFEKTKITLGELKNIEQGLVVDISSVYDNKINLKVENKTIATGELVIINDRYGVRIDEVFASDASAIQENVEKPAVADVPAVEEPVEPKAEEEFDYSDFELDDQDI